LIGDLVAFQGRDRIVFCESDAFGDIVADLRDRERLLRLPAARRPAPRKPREGSQHMWLLPEFPPAMRGTEEFLRRRWHSLSMIERIRTPAEMDPDDEDIPF
jgi:hypothetical protein